MTFETATSVTHKLWDRSTVHPAARHPGPRPLGPAQHPEEQHRGPRQRPQHLHAQPEPRRSQPRDGQPLAPPTRNTTTTTGVSRRRRRASAEVPGRAQPPHFRLGPVHVVVGGDQQGLGQFLVAGRIGVRRNGRSARPTDMPSRSLVPATVTASGQAAPDTPGHRLQLRGVFQPGDQAPRTRRRCNRVTVSASRTARESIRATCSRTWSPAAWPRVSLTCLKLLTSQKSTPTRCRCSPARARAASRLSSSCRRLAGPSAGHGAPGGAPPAGVGRGPPRRPRAAGARWPARARIAAVGGRRRRSSGPAGPCRPRSG